MADSCLDSASVLGANSHTAQHIDQRNQLVALEFRCLTDCLPLECGVQLLQQLRKDALRSNVLLVLMLANTCTLREAKW